MKNEKKKLLIYIAGGCVALALGLGIVAYRHPHVAAANGAVVSIAGKDMEPVADSTATETTVSGNDIATASGNDAATVSGNDTATVSGNDAATVSGNDAVTGAAAFSTRALEEGMTLNDLPALTIASGVSFAEVQDPEAISFAVAPDEEESEYANLAIAQVTDYVNVRSLPSTDGEIVGKIYNGSVAQVLATAGDNDDWFQIISGDVEGFIKAEYFLYGEEAEAVIDQYVTYYATVLADRLNVREEQSADSRRIGYIDNGENVKVVEDCGDWLKVQYTDSKQGYVSAEYVSVHEEFVYAKSIEEERREEAERQALAARAQEAEQSTPEVIGNITFPTNQYTSNEELRTAIVDYAMQYLGNKYVHGGRSLAGGTDCSGFTSYIYKDFGYSLSRTPSGQYSTNGRSVSYDEIQPGDIICYGKSKCTHVGLYIGDGQIIHSANSRKGVIISAADYDNILAIKNVID
ncbi:MAG: C40 family peptidase [Lachnospiraceae bacterium]|nr:C40 family peptidase [Lachnospiraceae bacterium]